MCGVQPVLKPSIEARRCVTPIKYGHLTPRDIAFVFEAPLLSHDELYTQLHHIRYVIFDSEGAQNAQLEFKVWLVAALASSRNLSSTCYHVWLLVKGVFEYVAESFWPLLQVPPSLYHSAAERRIREILVYSMALQLFIKVYRFW